MTDAEAYLNAQGMKAKLDEAVGTAVKERAPDCARRVAEILLQQGVTSLEAAHRHHSECDSIGGAEDAEA